ncbi:hypothetical protein TSUD_391860 [Trifolium subterraneum]|uniref:Peptidase A1 domain-containing protein n=1 Tax=Trifolium subterraneum TaxID=3900 RepID=A0A2Z6MZ60_TRISU|nr:hypothetical protein TSUD_391860 [Trifolium subterraneum]
MIAIFMFTAAAILTTAAVISAASPLTLTLERAFPNQGLDLDQLRARDASRHRRILKSSQEVVAFDVNGTANNIIGLYYTKVLIGTPPVEYTLQIDTASDVLWVSCTSCTGCPQTSGLEALCVCWGPVICF